ncbi:intercellular adhesion molecule 4-like isoform X1 [Chelonoidis abingdonii]|uniref:Intercellular adhesion molecule N-terminal domain-containing protein n=1 Tax=Chelonoidis abingdonii TaxID=106734 RepID=A0A8C0FWA3_CHEAB
MRPQRLQHPFPGGSLAWLLLLLALPGTAQGSFEVRVSPEAPMVEHGGSVWINCSTTCRNPDANGSLETSLTKTDSKSGPGWAAFLLVGITEWVSAPQCYFTCGGDTKVAAANISSYRPPEQVVLEPLPEMELGRAYNLTCRVLNVAPVTHLTVTIRQGGRTLHTETFQNHTVIKLDNRTVTHEVTPRRWDLGLEITCHAALDLTPHGPHFKNSSSAVELQEAESLTAKIIAISAIATISATLLGILAWGLAQWHRPWREARPEPGEATPSQANFEMAQASIEDAPEEGGSLNPAEDVSP